MSSTDPAQPKKRRVWLVVLLVVIGGFLFVVVPVLLLIAIPTLGNMSRYANETSAIQSMRVIQQAETAYSSTYPAAGYACSMQVLGGDPHSGPATATSAQILQPDLAGGVKAGYKFTIANCVRTNSNGAEQVTGYQVIAQPLTVGKTGNRSFCSDETGEIKFDPTGGANCTQALQQ